MSAQAGVWNFDGAPDRETLVNISQTISQYGPDGESIYLGGPTGMVYRPFHTTKESRLERQPHTSRRGNVIMWDGRLDSCEELIQLLGSDTDPEQTDVSIVIAAFERWGLDCFAKLVGDWALSIWNPTQKTLVLARDYVGVRHLYYYPSPKRIIWCSHLGPLVLSGDRFTLNDEYVAGYLALYPEADLTPYRGIHVVPPGSFVHVKDGKITVHPFWTFQPEVRIRYRTDIEYEDHFRQVFRQAVRRRLRSDSPILAELSGGLDSSSIVCMADDIISRSNAEVPRVDTLSIYDPREPGGNEHPYFTKVEEKRGKKGHHFDASKYDNFFDLDHRDFRVVPGASGRPGGLSAALAELIQNQGYRVLISGVGGDEFLGGVPNPEPQLADLIVQPHPIKLVRQLAAWSASKKRPWIQLFFQAAVLLLPFSLRVMFTQKATIAPWIDTAFARRYRVGAMKLGPHETYGFWLPSRREYAQTLVTMRRQFACSPPPAWTVAEKRYPYLDQTLIEFLLSIPASQLLRPGQRRSLMRRALADLVPHEILFRRTKGFVARSVLAKLRDTERDLERLFASPLSTSVRYINQAKFLNSLRAARNGDAQQMVPLLKAIHLELWLRSLAEHKVVGLEGCTCTETWRGKDRNSLEEPPQPRQFSAGRVTDSNQGGR